MSMLLSSPPCSLSPSPSPHFSAQPLRRSLRARPPHLPVTGSSLPLLGMEFSERLRRGQREVAAASDSGGGGWWPPLLEPAVAELQEESTEIVDCRCVLYRSGMFELMGLLQLRYLAGGGGGGEQWPKLGLGFGLTVMITVPASVLVVVLHLADAAKGIAYVLGLLQAIKQ